MNPVFFVGVITACLILISGCIQAPDVTTSPNNPVPIVKPGTGTPIPLPVNTTERITLSPIRSSRSPTVAVVTVPTAAKDPIVGQWTLANSKDYQCEGVFRDDKTGYMVCSAAFIPVSNEDVKWEISQASHSFLRNYTITQIGNGDSYWLRWSSYTGQLSGERFPKDSYFVRMK